MKTESFVECPSQHNSYEADMRRDANKLISAWLPEIVRDIRHIKKLDDDFMKLMRWVCNHEGDTCLRFDYLAIARSLRDADFDAGNALDLIAYLREKHVIKPIYNPKKPDITGQDEGSFTFTLSFYDHIAGKLAQLLPPQL